MSVQENKNNNINNTNYQIDHYNILITPSGELFNQSLVVMMSAIINCKYPCHFYIMQNTWTEEQKEECRNFVTAYPKNKVEYITVDDNDFKSFTPWKGRYGTYYKILAHIYLPDDVSRILYLDCDTIVNKDIYKYYSMDFDGNYIIASTETLAQKSYIEWEKTGFEKHGFMNGGVVLLNLEKIRESNITAETYKNAIKKFSGFYFADQGLLSFIFKDKIKLLPSYKYNHLLFQVGEKNKIYTYQWAFSLKKEERQNLVIFPYWNEEYSEEDDETIIHYTGSYENKPWQVYVAAFNQNIQILNIPYMQKNNPSYPIIERLYQKWWDIVQKMPYKYIEYFVLQPYLFIQNQNINFKNDRIIYENALNFCCEICCDNFGHKKFRRYISNLHGQTVSLLKQQDRAAKVFKAAADACQVKIIFSSDKNSLFQLNDEEFNKCKDADVVITCCVHGTKTHERDGVKCIDIVDILYDNSITESLPQINDMALLNFSEKVLKEFEKLSTSISEQNRSLSAQLSESHINENEIKAGQFEIKNLYNKITVSTEERKKLEEQIDYLNGSLDISKRQTDAFSQERSSLYKTIGQMESMIERYETDIQSLLQKNDSLEAELKKAQIDSQTDSKHIRTLETECESLKAQISEMENSRSWRYTKIFRKNKKEVEK